MTSERDRIALVRAVFGDAGVRVGIGDDAAALDVAAGTLVWTVDAQVDGTHFRREWVSWEDAGFRSFMAAASDLAAMGAEPLAALSSLVLAPDVDDAALSSLVRGQAEAAREVGAPVVGGNLARGAETSITTTLLGKTPAPILRAGAREGDLVFAAGELGLARAGLLALQKSVQDARVSAALAAWRRPRARIADGLAMRGLVTSAMDVSDGLAGDAQKLAEASAVTVVLDAAALVTPALCDAATAIAEDALSLALEGGEDYALLATGSSPPPGFSMIGRVEAGPASVVLLRDGARVPIDARGFDHFDGR